MHGSASACSPRPSCDQAATRWAQGGVAAVLGGDPDSTDLHLADTLAAGAGLCDVDAVRVLVDEGPGRVHELIAMGAVFDRDREGELLLAREGGHSLARSRARRRRRHRCRDRAGARRRRCAPRPPSCWEHWFALDLLVERRPLPRRAWPSTPTASRTRSRPATSCWPPAAPGQLFAATTNPLLSTGDGLAMALRAGVPCADVEFMQFHPTALFSPRMPRPLLSEALRGHGALIRDATASASSTSCCPATSSRAITAKLIEHGTDHVWLDATGLERFDERFPTIAADRVAGRPRPRPPTGCRSLRPPTTTAVASSPTSTAPPRCPACGPPARWPCTGVHGANRLASNSLLEGMVFGPRVIEAIGQGVDGTGPAAARCARCWRAFRPGRCHRRRPYRRRRPRRRRRRPAAMRERSLQRSMTRCAGVLRSARSPTRPRPPSTPSRARRPVTRSRPRPYELVNLVTRRQCVADRRPMSARRAAGCHTRLTSPTRPTPSTSAS